MAQLLEEYNEKSAIQAIQMGVEMDRKKRYTQSYHYYMQGIDLLHNILKSTTCIRKKGTYRVRINEYITRAEIIKEYMINQKQTKGEDYHECISVEEDSIGNDYNSLIGVYFQAKNLTKVEIDEPYVRNLTQFFNFLRFCEMIVKADNAIVAIILNTKPIDNCDVQNNLEALKGNLRCDYRIDLQMNYNLSLHDRQIRLNTGWTIKMGRGLNMYKPVTKNHIGVCDSSLRKCLPCSIDIYYDSK